MSNDEIFFKQPSCSQTDRGTPRKVGVELEFSGLTLLEATTALQRSLGGEVREISTAEQELRVDPLGDLKIELDWNFLKRKATEEAEKEEPGVWIDTLSDAAALVVPVEVVCPPIAVNDLNMLDPMVAALREAGAVGTEESFLAAYGVHINTEIPNLEAPTLLAYLKAYAVTQWWLVDAHEIDPARKLSPYIDLYPEAYLRQVLSRQSASLDQIFDDYLEHNASRNRALDLLPLLAEINEERVKRTVDDPRIKARPAFHYRLPNCHIERPDWSLADPWNLWWVVDQLAHRAKDLDELSAAFLEADRPVLGVNRRDWVTHVDQWLKDRALA